jgi:hypothetical protein
MVIRHELFFRKVRAVVTPAIPFPIMMTCSIEVKVIISQLLIGHTYITFIVLKLKPYALAAKPSTVRI